MSFVDFILNVAALLLWMRWRSLPFDPFNKRIPATLIGTLRRAAPSRFRRWHLLAVIGALLILRALFYWQVGSAIRWAGKIDLGIIALFFPADSFGRMVLFSILSFGLTLGIFYLWVLLLSIACPRAEKSGLIHSLVRMQLGRVDDWPLRVKIILPFAVTAFFWWLVSWLLMWNQIIPPFISPAHRIEEACVIGLGSYLAWKFVLAALLVLHLLNTYIYFGKQPVWNYVNALAQTLLKPLKKIPLQLGRVDFAPIVGIALVFFIAQTATLGLAKLYAALPF
ncbi:MAG TPA: hypothetical protein VIK59_05305 [Verrucomicrobiae bacterium]